MKSVFKLTVWLHTVLRPEHFQFSIFIGSGLELMIFHTWWVPGLIACAASVSNWVIGWKLERKQKKVERGGGGEKRKHLPANPTILENAPWYFTVRFICKLTAHQNRSITNRLPFDYQICKITLFSNRTRSRRLQEL